MEFDWNKPDSVNAQGVKWWIDKELTLYANKPDQFGVALHNWKVFMVEEKDGNRIRLLIDDKNSVVDANKAVEPLACKIDFIKTSIGIERSTI